MRKNVDFDIKVWAQMFFDDGSVSEGIRINAESVDDDITLQNVANHILQSLGRDEGLLLIWGDGNIIPINVKPSIFSRVKVT
jgi:hypothetical protein